MGVGIRHASSHPACLGPGLEESFAKVFSLVSMSFKDYLSIVESPGILLGICSDAVAEAVPLRFVLDWVEKSAANTSLDEIPIAFAEATVLHSPAMNTRNKALTTEARQGAIIQIAGPHDTGKMTILQLLCGQLRPSSGEVLVSPHLEILYIPHEPLFIQGQGLFNNLHMISTLQEFRNVNVERGFRILHRLRLDKPWIKDISACREFRNM